MRVWWRERDGVPSWSDLPASPVHKGNAHPVQLAQQHDQPFPLRQLDLKGNFTMPACALATAPTHLVIAEPA